MSRAELSAGSGLSRRKIAKYERGRGPVTDGDRRALAAALDVELEELIPPIPEPGANADTDTNADNGADSHAESDSEIDTDAAADASPDNTTTAESSDAPVALDDVETASEPETVEPSVATGTTAGTTDTTVGAADTTDTTDGDTEAEADCTDSATDPADVAPEPLAPPVASAAEADAVDEVTDAPEPADPDAERGTLPGVAPDALLREYLSMLLELRDTQRISPTSLRQEDLSELATALGGTPEAIEARLMELLGTDEQEAWQLRRTILPSLGATSSRR